MTCPCHSTITLALPPMRSIIVLTRSLGGQIALSLTTHTLITMCEHKLDPFLRRTRLTPVIEKHVRHTL